MAIVIFMEITNPIIGIGDSKDLNATFELMSLTYSAVSPANTTGNGGKPSMSPITVTLNAQYGPSLLSSLLQNQFHTVTFTIAKTATSGTDQVYQQIVIEKALITLFQESVGGGDAQPILELSFIYRTLTFSEPSTNTTVTYQSGILG